MTLPADRRARLLAAKREIAELLKPETEARKIARRKAARDRRKAMKAEPMKNQRTPRERDPGFLAYLRRQPCCVGPLLGDPCEGRTDPAHIRFSDPSVGRLNAGLSNKSDDRWCVPVCRKHHEAQHAHGNERHWWSEIVRADPNELARRHYDFYLKSSGKTTEKVEK